MPEGAFEELRALPYEERDHASQPPCCRLAAGRPMDRLVCGDVGFARSGWRCAPPSHGGDGKQVAVVVQTTRVTKADFAVSSAFRRTPARLAQA